MVKRLYIASVVLVELGQAVEEQDWSANVVGNVELELAFVRKDCVGARIAVRSLCLYCSPKICAAAVFGLEVGADQVARHLSELPSRLCRTVGIVD